MEDKTCSEIFSERLAELRQQHNETSRDLARALDVSFSAISNYQLGKRTPDIVFLQKVARHYSVSADYLLGLSDVKSTEQDMKIACEVTGLSEEAIKNITFYELCEYPGEDFLNICNDIPEKILEKEFFPQGMTCAFIESDEFQPFINALDKAFICRVADIYECDAFVERLLKYPELVGNYLEHFGSHGGHYQKISKAYIMDAYEATNRFIENSIKDILSEEAPDNAQHNPEEE
jgi:transcriptional regulator with XRE-family HTH domain